MFDSRKVQEMWNVFHSKTSDLALIRSPEHFGSIAFIALSLFDT